MVRIPAFHAGGPGSIPGVGTCFFLLSEYTQELTLYIIPVFLPDIKNGVCFTCLNKTGLLEPRGKVASAGNRTRAARVAGEHSTTEPPMLVGVNEENV